MVLMWLLEILFASQYENSYNFIIIIINDNNGLGKHFTVNNNMMYTLIYLLSIAKMTDYLYFSFTNSLSQWMHGSV